MDFDAYDVAAFLAGVKRRFRVPVSIARDATVVDPGPPGTALWVPRIGERPLAPVDIGFRPGQRLWVREPWRVANDGTTLYSDIRKTDERRAIVSHAPATMPRSRARATLCVERVRVDRLTRAGNMDARADGVEFWPEGAVYRRDNDAALRFRKRWIARYGDAAWMSDPWVAVVEFRPVRLEIASADLEMPCAGAAQ